MKKTVGSLLALAVLASAAVAQAPGENAYCSIGDIWTGAGSDGPAVLPMNCIYTGLDGTPSPGKITVVQPGPNVNGASVITQALRAATCGDTIELVAGQTYLPFVLPSKNCDAAHWITIRTTAPDSALPPEHRRINPSYAGVPLLPDRPPYSGGKSNVMAKIQTRTTAVPVGVVAGANYYRLGPGLEITRTLGTGIVFDMAVVTGADHIIFDRDWIHGSELFEETTNGVKLGGATNVAVINSYLNDFKCLAFVGACTDAHAISGGDGLQTHAEGTWKAYNNFIEASGENILHGGALKGNEVPMDLDYRENHFYKPLSWHACTPKVSCYVVKNLFELKNASRVLLEGNLMEGSWGGYTQSGFAILLTPRGEWAHVEDITVRYNHISHVGNGFQLAATTMCDGAYIRADGKCPTQIVDSGGAGRWSIHDVLVDDVQGVAYGGTGNQAQIGSDYRVNPPLHDLLLDHITFVSYPPNTFILTLGTNPLNPRKRMGPFTYTNSIIQAGPANIWQTGAPMVCAADWNPIQSFNNCFTGYTVANNVIAGWPPVGTHPPTTRPPWPAGNWTPADYSTVFVRPAPYGGDYHTLPPYTGIGADIDALNAYLSGVE
jgi:hypothetical protein